MDIVVLVGRILFGTLAIMSALGGHFGNTDGIAGYAQARGVKSGARALVLISGVMLLLAGVSIILGIWPDLGALLFFLFLVPTALLIHHFWTDDDPMMKQNEQTQFMKDMSLAGASLIAFTYFVTVGEAGPLQITGSLFDL
jgi:putative oxidoreductase